MSALNFASVLSALESVDFKQVANFIVPYESLRAASSLDLVLLAHLLLFGLLFGVLIWVTFISGITLFKTLPRKDFGLVQSVLFPWYFRVCSFALGYIILCVYVEQYGFEPFVKLAVDVRAVTNVESGLALVRSFSAPLLVLTVHNVQLALLASAWLASTVQQFVLGPITTKLMKARQAATEKAASNKDSKLTAQLDQALKSANGRFGAVHGISSLYNLHVLFVAIAHALYLANSVFTFTVAAPVAAAAAAAVPAGVQTQ